MFAPSTRFVFLLFLPVLGFSQPDCTSITGKILDQDHRPVSGAHLYSSVTHSSGVSGPDGGFTVAVEPVDTLLISFVGYVNVSINLDGKDLCDTLTVVLVEEKILLPEITIYSFPTRLLEKQERPPYPIAGINAEPQNVHKYDQPFAQILRAKDKPQAEHLYKDLHTDPSAIPFIGPHLTITGVFTSIQNKFTSETRQKEKLRKVGREKAQHVIDHHYMEILENEDFRKQFSTFFSIDKGDYQNYLNYFQTTHLSQKSYPSDYYLIADFYENFEKFLQSNTKAE